MLYRGVGCIFTEMITGVATFPGMKDAYDQLDRIWRLLGTPTEETWEGVSRFPNYVLGRYIDWWLSNFQFRQRYEERLWRTRSWIWNIECLECEFQAAWESHVDIADWCWNAQKWRILLPRWGSILSFPRLEPISPFLIIVCVHADQRVEKFVTSK